MQHELHRHLLWMATIGTKVSSFVDLEDSGGPGDHPDLPQIVRTGHHSVPSASPKRMSSSHQSTPKRTRPPPVSVGLRVGTTNDGSTTRPRSGCSAAGPSGFFNSAAESSTSSATAAPPNLPSRCAHRGAAVPSASTWATSTGRWGWCWRWRSLNLKTFFILLVLTAAVKAISSISNGLTTAMYVNSQQLDWRSHVKTVSERGASVTARECAHSAQIPEPTCQVQTSNGREPDEAASSTSQAHSSSRPSTRRSLNLKGFFILLVLTAAVKAISTTVKVSRLRCM